MKAKGLGVKLAFYIITATIIIVGAILWINHSISKKLLLKNVEENAANLTQSTVNKIEGVLGTVAKIPENESYVFKDFDITTEQLHSYIRMIVKNNKEVFGGCVAFEPYSYYKDSLYFAPYCYKSEDSIICENLGTETYQYFYWDWYQIPSILQKPVWSEPYFDEGGGNILMCTYSVPFYRKSNGEKKFRGVVTVDISLEWLDELVSCIKIYEHGYAFLLSQNGTVITHPNDKYEMHQTVFSLAEEYNVPELREVGRKMISGKSGFIEYTSIYTHQEGFMYYYPLETTGWSLAVLIPREELFADLYALNKRLLLIGVIGIIVLLVLIVATSQRITGPLRKLVKVTDNIGKGNFDVVLPPVKGNDEIAKLNSSISAMQRELKTYIRNLKDTTAAKEKIESELKIAHDIQQGIIPKIFPPFPERDDVDLYAVLDPARDVGGDLYDFFFLDDYNLCFAVGDVSGKGVPASLFMAITRTLLRAKVSIDLPVNEIVKSINLELCQGNENSMFVTFFLGIIDLKNGLVNYCNAGHNLPYILRSDCKIETLTGTHGTPMGIFEDMEYKTETLQLNNTDTLVIYTDGVPEAMNFNNELFGDDRLKKLLLQFCRTNPIDVTTAMVNEVKKYTGEAEQSDDITILSLTFFSDKKVKKHIDDTRELILRNDIAELYNLKKYIDSLALEWKMDQKLVININLVLEEVLTNIIFYGYADKQQHQILLFFSKQDGRLEIRVEDDARPFNPLETDIPEDFDKPLEKRKIGGLGIHLMKNLMDNFSYKRENNKNILILIKNCSINA